MIPIGTLLWWLKEKALVWARKRRKWLLFGLMMWVLGIAAGWWTAAMFIEKHLGGAK